MRTLVVLALLGLACARSKLSFIEDGVTMHKLTLRLSSLILLLMVSVPGVASAWTIEGELVCSETDSVSVLLEWTVEDVSVVAEFWLWRAASPFEGPYESMGVGLQAESPGRYEDCEVSVGSSYRYMLRALLTDGRVAHVSDGVCEVFVQGTPTEHGTWGCIKALYR